MSLRYSPWSVPNYNNGMHVDFVAEAAKMDILRLFCSSDTDVISNLENESRTTE